MNQRAAILSCLRSIGCTLLLAACGSNTGGGAEQATSGGATSTNVVQGGASHTGGTVSLGGSQVGSTGGTIVVGGHSSLGSGGTESLGGSPSTGGQSGTGGRVASTGGSETVGGMSGTGGRIVTGGSPATGGNPQSGGAAPGGAATGGGKAGTGGLVLVGGASGLGGLASTGGQIGSGGNFNPCAGVGGQSSTGTRLVAFGTTLDPKVQICESWQLAQSLAKPSSSTWRAKGDQRRTYRFAAANADVAYRICVPTNWDGTSKLPLVMFLHGAGNDESSYLDQNNKQMVTLANQHGYVLVSPLGYNGAYGNFLRLPAVFGQPTEAQKFIDAVTADTERTNELSEKDVINVIELALNEYPIDRSAMFLMGHSMGSGGTWYIGGKYSSYWAALAPMSGPFVQETGYPWDNLRTMPIFMTEGTLATSLAGSRVLRDWMNGRGFKLTYKEVVADHPGMVPLVLPDNFDFFDRVRTGN